MMDQLDIPHFDGANRRVYWVWIASCNEKRPEVLEDSPVEYVPYYGLTYKSLNPDKKEYPKDKERWRIGNWLCEKPYFKVDGNFVQLKEEMRVWLEEARYSYVIQNRWTLNRFGWYVGLHDKAAAAHFKLVWGK